jgi:Protein of unknown function (DUF1194)
MTVLRALIIAMSALLMSGMAAAEEADLELVLLADSSGSIDNAEIMFQRRGYAEALISADVLDAIRTGARQKIAVTYVEWGDFTSQDIVVPWRIIGDAASAQAFAAELMEKPRRARGRNAIGQALVYGMSLIEQNDIEAYRKVIDISADSANSWNGVPLSEARDQVVASGITVNGLAVLCRQCSGRPVSYDLEDAFEKTIIGGPDAFVITADDMQQFSTAVKRKLILEIASGPQGVKLAYD